MHSVRFQETLQFSEATENAAVALASACTDSAELIRSHVFMFRFEMRNRELAHNITMTINA